MNVRSFHRTRRNRCVSHSFVLPPHLGIPARSVIPLLLIAAMLNACNREPTWQGTPITTALTVPAIPFADSMSRPVALMPAAGEAAMVFFGYTNCPDVCPTTLADWARVKTALGDKSKLVHFFFVTVDPERDTPAIAQRYAAQFDSSFVGLSGTPEATIAVQKAFAVASSKLPSSSAAEYLVGHPAQTFLMDDQGRVRVSYAFGAGWDAMTADLKQLLR